MQKLPEVSNRKRRWRIVTCPLTYTSGYSLVLVKQHTEALQKGECRQGWRYFWPCRTHVGFGSATGPTLKTALCHIRALVGRIDKYQRSPRTLLGVCVWPFLSSSWVAIGRPSYLWAVLPSVPRHWRFPPASGGHPPRLLPPSGGGYWLAPQKGKCRRGRRYF